MFLSELTDTYRKHDIRNNHNDDFAKTDQNRWHLDENAKDESKDVSEY